MRFDDRAFTVRAYTDVGPWLPTDDLTNMTVQLIPGISGSTSQSTLQLQGSQDGTNPVDLGSASAVAASVSLAGQAWKYLRVNTMVYVAGAPAAIVGGHNTRTE